MMNLPTLTLCRIIIGQGIEEEAAAADEQFAHKEEGHQHPPQDKEHERKLERGVLAEVIV